MSEQIKGIDVSVNNGTIAWERVTAAFAMLKASQGRSLSGAYRNFADRNFAANLKAACARGIRCGCYHYLTAKSVAEAREEADYFVSVIKPYKAQLTLWAAVDVEEDKYLLADKAALTAIIVVFCDRVKAAGFEPMVYTNPNYLKYRLNDIGAYPLWLALWRDKSNVPSGYKNLKLWQYGVGRADGVSGDCDLNLGIALPDAAVDKWESIQRRCGLDDNTIRYLRAYKYADALADKLYKQMV